MNFHVYGMCTNNIAFENFVIIEKKKMIHESLIRVDWKFEFNNIYNKIELRVTRSVNILKFLSRLNFQ